MTGFGLAGAVVLCMMAGVALAQTTPQSTITTTPMVVVPPPGTLSTTTTEKSVDSNGTPTESTGTSYRNSDGVAAESVTKTTTYPPHGHGHDEQDDDLDRHSIGGAGDRARNDARCLPAAAGI